MSYFESKLNSHIKKMTAEAIARKYIRNRVDPNKIKALLKDKFDNFLNVDSVYSVAFEKENISKI